MTPPTIAIGNVPAIPPQKPANPTEDPNHPPAVAPPIVATTQKEQLDQMINVFKL